MLEIFQSTLPARGATILYQEDGDGEKEFQSTLPARGATSMSAYIFKQTMISIHAPRTGSDDRRGHKHHRQRHFNPRSPHGERRRSLCRTGWSRTFQSTLPARGATPAGRQPGKEQKFQSTLPARGATRRHGGDGEQVPFQSTLPARGATRSRRRNGAASRFQSTLPARGATTFLRGTQLCSNFNPRSPHGERHRDATRTDERRISIHAPRTGSDPAEGTNEAA